VAAAFATACGSSDSGGGSSGSTGGSAGGGLQAYTSCLSKNGVDIQTPAGGLPSGMPGGGFPSGAPGGAFPSGGPGAMPSGMAGGGMFQKPTGVDDATWQKAQTACASVRPSMGAGAGQDDSAVRAYLSCLSKHGAATSGSPTALNTADPKVAAAQKACVALRPSAGPSAN
jgi:hypothetical protein